MPVPPNCKWGGAGGRKRANEDGNRVQAYSEVNLETHPRDLERIQQARTNSQELHVEALAPYAADLIRKPSVFSLHLI